MWECVCACDSEGVFKVYVLCDGADSVHLFALCVCLCVCVCLSLSHRSLSLLVVGVCVGKGGAGGTDR